MTTIQVISVIILNTVFYGNILNQSESGNLNMQEAFRRISFVFMMTMFLIFGKLALFFSVAIVKTFYDLFSGILTYEVSGFTRKYFRTTMIENIVCLATIILYSLGA